MAKPDPAKRVEPVLTRWAEPLDRRQICLRMDLILQRCGVAEEHVRTRMTAHAIFASGWKQKCWHHNAWGVQLGGWKGPWYAMDTTEADAEGNYYPVAGQPWRAFGSWCEAVEDFRGRIKPGSKRYGAAYEQLINPALEGDAEYWDALGKGGYYTDQNFTGTKFAKLCSRVRSEICAAMPNDMLSATTWANAHVPSSDHASVPAELAEQVDETPLWLLLGAFGVFIIIVVARLFL